MNREAFGSLMGELTAIIGDRAVEPALEAGLQAEAGTDSDLFHRVEAACHAAIEAGWMCKHEAGGIRYGRVLKPSPELGGYSVDVVMMRDLAGPHHRHPRGEIDMIMPIDPAARFDGHGRGWCVYGPDTAHSPTVSGGSALVLYLLPGGEIEFS